MNLAKREAKLASLICNMLALQVPHSIFKRRVDDFPRCRWEDVAVPRPVVTEADAKHPPPAFALGRVVNNIRRPRDAESRVFWATEAVKTWPATGLPGKTALRPAHHRPERTAVLALIDTPLAGGAIATSLRGARSRRAERKQNQNRKRYPNSARHPNWAEYLHAQVYDAACVALVNCTFYLIAFCHLRLVAATSAFNARGTVG